MTENVLNNEEENSLDLYSDFLDNSYSEEEIQTLLSNNALDRVTPTLDLNISSQSSNSGFQDNLYVDFIIDEHNNRDLDKLKKIEKEKNELSSVIDNLKKKNHQLQNKIIGLENNISSLYKTAQAEIKRKNTEIHELRQQLDNFLFRRRQTFRSNDKENSHSNETPIRPYVPLTPPSNDESKSVENYLNLDGSVAKPLTIHLSLHNSERKKTEKTNYQFPVKRSIKTETIWINKKCGSSFVKKTLGKEGFRRRNLLEKNIDAQRLLNYSIGKRKNEAKLYNILKVKPKKRTDVTTLEKEITSSVDHANRDGINTENASTSSSILRDSKKQSVKYVSPRKYSSTKKTDSSKHGRNPFAKMLEMCKRKYSFNDRSDRVVKDEIKDSSKLSNVELPSKNLKNTKRLSDLPKNKLSFEYETSFSENNPENQVENIYTHKSDSSSIKDTDKCRNNAMENIVKCFDNTGGKVQKCSRTSIEKDEKCSSMAVVDEENISCKVGDNVDKYSYNAVKNEDSKIQQNEASTNSLLNNGEKLAKNIYKFPKCDTKKHPSDTASNRKDLCGSVKNNFNTYHDKTKIKSCKSRNNESSRSILYNQNYKHSITERRIQSKRTSKEPERKPKINSDRTEKALRQRSRSYYDKSERMSRLKWGSREKLNPENNSRLKSDKLIQNRKGLNEKSERQRDRSTCWKDTPVMPDRLKTSKGGTADINRPKRKEDNTNGSNSPSSILDTNGTVESEKPTSRKDNDKVIHYEKAISKRNTKVDTERSISNWDHITIESEINFTSDNSVNLGSSKSKVGSSDFNQYPLKDKGSNGTVDSEKLISVSVNSDCFKNKCQIDSDRAKIKATSENPTNTGTVVDSEKLTCKTNITVDLCRSKNEFNIEIDSDCPTNGILSVNSEKQKSKRNTVHSDKVKSTKKFTIGGKELQSIKCSLMKFNKSVKGKKNLPNKYLDKSATSNENSHNLEIAQEISDESAISKENSDKSAIYKENSDKSAIYKENSDKSAIYKEISDESKILEKKIDEMGMESSCKVVKRLKFLNTPEMNNENLNKTEKRLEAHSDFTGKLSGCNLGIVLKDKSGKCKENLDRSQKIPKLRTNETKCLESNFEKLDWSVILNPDLILKDPRLDPSRIGKYPKSNSDEINLKVIKYESNNTLSYKKYLDKTTTINKVVQSFNNNLIRNTEIYKNPISNTLTGMHLLKSKDITNSPGSKKPENFEVELSKSSPKRKREVIKENIVTARNFFKLKQSDKMLKIENGDLRTEGSNSSIQPSPKKAKRIEVFQEISNNTILPSVNVNLSPPNVKTNVSNFNYMKNVSVVNNDTVNSNTSKCSIGPSLEMQIDSTGAGPSNIVEERDSDIDYFTF